MSCDLYTIVGSPLCSLLLACDADLVGSITEVLSGITHRVGRVDNHHDEQKDRGEDDHLAQCRTVGTELGPLTASISGVSLDSIITELVVDHATECNAVAEELKAGDLSAPDQHRGGHKQNILQDTTESEDQN